MKKKQGAALALSCAMLCTALTGCGMGYAGDDVYRDTGAVTNLSLKSETVQCLSDDKVKDASKAADGAPDTWYTVHGKEGTLELDFGGEKTFDTIVLREKGWNVQQYHLEALVKQDGEEKWEIIYIGDRIEDVRMCALEKEVTASKLRLNVDSAVQTFSIREIEVSRSVPVRDDEFRVQGYVSCGCLMDGSLFDPQSNTYLDPATLDVVTEINLIGHVNMRRDGTIAIEYSIEEEDGTYQTNEYTDEEFLAALDRLRAVIGTRDVELTMTIATGNGENALSAMRDNRDALVRNTVAFAERFGFQGVSYDWERPENQEQFDVFSDYLIALRPALDAAGKRLTLAWAAWSINMKPEAVKTADAIEIMSYDLFDQYGNQASFLESTVQPVDYFLSLGYDLKQLNLGIPYYGRPEDGGPYWPFYNDERYHLGRYDDTDSEFTAEVGKSYFNSYQTVMDKTAYAISRGAGGVMLFRLELDRPFSDENSLTKAIGKTMAQRLAQEGGN